VLVLSKPLPLRLQRGILSIGCKQGSHGRLGGYAQGHRRTNRDWRLIDLALYKVEKEKLKGWLEDWWLQFTDVKWANFGRKGRSLLCRVRSAVSLSRK